MENKPQFVKPWLRYFSGFTDIFDREAKSARPGIAVHLVGADVDGYHLTGPFRLLFCGECGFTDCLRLLASPAVLRLYRGG